MKSTWSGNIAFEGVRVPVKMYPAVKSGTGFSLNTAHGKDKGRLRQQYICSVCGEVVGKEDKVKAYFTGKKDIVAKAIFTDVELSSLKLDNSDTIQIIAVKKGGVEGDIHELAVRSGTPFYFGCQDIGNHIYSFFHKTLEKLKEQEKYAIGIGYMRGKSIIFRFEPYRNVILGLQVVYPDRLYLDCDSIEGKQQETSGELLAKGLIISTKIEKKPYNYMEQKDSFVQEARNRLEAKILGKELKIKVEKPQLEIKTQDLEQMIAVSV